MHCHFSLLTKAASICCRLVTPKVNPARAFSLVDAVHVDTGAQVLNAA
jgi:hypothetical protein